MQEQGSVQFTPASLAETQADKEAGFDPAERVLGVRR